MSTERANDRALELRGIVKRFGSVTALDAMDLDVRRGTVHALLGENGAGKSTAMRIAHGLVRPDAGVVRLFGRDMAAHSPRASAAGGAGMVHQHLSLVPSLTVTENLLLGERGLFDATTAAARLTEVMESSRLRVPAQALVRDLSIVEQQRLEILKALVRGARLLILDEPTAVLAPSESRELLLWVKAFAARGGSVVLVTHKLREALSVADDVTVLRGGRVVFTGAALATDEQRIANAMFPGSAALGERAVPVGAGEIVVRAESVTIEGPRGARRIRGASFEVRRHEIVGIAAIEGSGHRELLAALAGRALAVSGSLRVPARVGFIPADRHLLAMVPDFTLTENVALRGLAARRGRMPWTSLAVRTRALIDRFAVVAPSERVLARTLSGGNQQRLVVGREIDGDTDLVVADNPTRGLDLRATAFVLDALRAAAARGAAVVFHSSDLDEVFDVATRVLVVFDGSVRDVGRDRDLAGRAMVGSDVA